MDNINLEKYKVFRELPEQYKSIKFCKLYMKMYNYMLSIPKEKIVIKNIINRNEYIGYLFRYISYFLEVKDFYNWKERIYNLLTEKLGATNYRKYELLYGSKAKEFFDRYLEKQKATCLEKYGKEYPAQSKEVQDKMKATCLEIYGKENVFQSKEIQEQIKSTNLERYGKEYYFQTEECRKLSKNTIQTKEHKEKLKNIWKNRTKEEKEQIENKKKVTFEKKYGSGITNPSQANEVKKKKEETCLKNHGVKNPYLLFNGHSKQADEMCEYIDKYFGYPEDSYYFTKNGEFFLKANDGTIKFYDYVNTKYKYIIEFNGVYWHGLLKDQKYVCNIPVEEIWKRDEEKKLLAEQNGYKIIYIRSDEYKGDKEKCLENLVKQIKAIMALQ